MLRRWKHLLFCKQTRELKLFAISTWTQIAACQQIPFAINALYCSKCISSVAFKSYLHTTYTRISVYPYTRIPVYPYTRISVYPYTRISVYPYIRISVYPYIRIPVYPYTRIPVYPFTRIPVYPYTRYPYIRISVYPISVYPYPYTRYPCFLPCQLPLNNVRYLRMQ